MPYADNPSPLSYAIQGMQAPLPLSDVRELRWTLASRGTPLLSHAQVAALALGMALDLTRLQGAVDEVSGAVLQPLPRAHRLLASARCLPHIAQVRRLQYKIILPCLLACRQHTLALFVCTSAVHFRFSRAYTTAITGSLLAVTQSGIGGQLSRSSSTTPPYAYTDTPIYNVFALTQRR